MLEAGSARRVFELIDKKRHSRKSFTCEVESLQRYLRTQACQDVRKKVAAVYVLAEGPAILGYYSLSGYTIDPGELHVSRRFPSYPKLPAILIGRLARDEKFRGLQIGERLVVDALRRALENSARVEAIAVIVEAENEKAQKFYLDFGFIQFPDHPSKLFILVSTVERSFSAYNK